jgi:hypothetical protein
VRVEDRQEGDGLDRRREQADAAAEQARTGRIQKPQRRGAEHGGGDARERVDVAGVQREGLLHARPTPVEEGEQEVQQIGERRRVGEVVRVQVVPEHRHRARHEMVGLVGVVNVGQPLPDAPQAQSQTTREHCRQPRPCPPARDLSSCHRSRSSGSCRCA